MMRRAVIVAIAVATAACFDTAGPPSTTAIDVSTVTPSSTTTLPASTSSSPVDDFDEDVCGAPDIVFTDRGLVATGGDESSDSAVIDSLAWSPVGGCQRLRIAFATLEGAPAVSPPAIEVEFLRHAGVLRVTFGPTVTDTVIGEQVVETGWIDRIYTVTRVDGRLFLDIHLREPVFARVQAESAPASVLIDVTPGGDPYPATPARSNDIVIMGPDPAIIGYPVTITGYTLDAVDRIEGVLNAADGSTVIGQAAVASADHTWHGFSMVFPDGPSGRVTISVDDGPQLLLDLP